MCLTFSSKEKVEAALTFLRIDTTKRDTNLNDPLGATFYYLKSSSLQWECYSNKIDDDFGDTTYYLIRE